MQHHTAQLCARFAPLQLGVGMKGATEYITLKLRRILREHPLSEVIQENFPERVYFEVNR